MASPYVVWGAPHSGSVPVEAVLTLIGAPFERVDRGDYRAVTRNPDYAAINPMRQVPALVLPSGELMTESAAILIYLADAHPEARLAPAVGSRLRPRYLRWMSFIATQVYGLYWIRDAPARLAAEPAHEPVIKERTRERIVECWGVMGRELAPAGRFLLGDEISALDVYLAAVSRWGPRRKGFYAAAPGLAAAVQAVDAEPRLAGLWAERMPFDEGWEG